VSNGDKNFEDYLEGKSPVSEKYAKFGDAEPPAELDAAILADAERAAKTHSHAAAKRSWFVPVSVAATVMICFSLVLNILREAPSGIDKDPAVDALIPAGRFDAPASLEPLSDSLRPAAPAEKKESVLQESAGGAAVTQSVTPQASVDSSRKMNRDDRQVVKSKDEVTGSADLATPEVKSFAREQQDSFAEAAPAVSMYQMEEMDSDQLTNLGQMMAVVTEYLSAEDAEAKGTLARLDSPAEATVPAAREAETSAYSGFAGLASVEEQPGRSAPEQPKTDEPDSLLQRIADLYRQSQNDTAAAALAEFRRAYPDHPVSRTLLERGY